MSDELKHKAQEGIGKVKEALGGATNDRDLQADGKSDQVEANLKQAGDKVKDAANKVKDAFS